MADLVEFSRRNAQKNWIPVGNQVTLGDADGNPIGTNSNPLVTSGGVGGSDVNIAEIDGVDAGTVIGAPTDAEVTGDGGLIGLLKRLRTLLTVPATVATPTEVVSGTGDVQGKAAAANLRLMGYVVRESAGIPAIASVILRHGTADSDPLIAPIGVAAGGNASAWFGPNGIAVPNGVFVDRTGGSTHLALFTIVAA